MLSTQPYKVNSNLRLCFFLAILLFACSYTSNAKADTSVKLSGITVTPFFVEIDEPFDITFRLTNQSDELEMLDQVQIWIQNESGNDLYKLNGQFLNTNIGITGNFSLTQTYKTTLLSELGREPGRYRVEVRGIVGGREFVFDVLGSATNGVQFSAKNPIEVEEPEPELVGRVDILDFYISGLPIQQDKPFSVNFDLAEHHNAPKILDDLELWVQDSNGNDLFKADDLGEQNFSANERKKYTSTVDIDSSRPNREPGTYQVVIRATVGNSTFNFDPNDAEAIVFPNSDSRPKNPLTFIVEAMPKVEGFVDLATPNVLFDKNEAQAGNEFSFSFELQEMVGAKRDIEFIQVWLSDEDDISDRKFLLKDFGSHSFESNQVKKFADTITFPTNPGIPTETNYTIWVWGKVSGESELFRFRYNGSFNPNLYLKKAGFVDLDGVIELRTIPSEDDLIEVEHSFTLAELSGGHKSFSNIRTSLIFPDGSQRILTISGGVSTGVHFVPGDTKNYSGVFVLENENGGSYGYLVEYKLPGSDEWEAFGGAENPQYINIPEGRVNILEGLEAPSVVNYNEPFDASVVLSEYQQGYKKFSSIALWLSSQTGQLIKKIDERKDVSFAPNEAKTIRFGSYSITTSDNIPPGTYYLQVIGSRALDERIVFTTVPDANVFAKNNAPILLTSQTGRGATDLKVEISSNIKLLRPGSNSFYAITITNNGPSNAKPQLLLQYSNLVPKLLLKSNCGGPGCYLNVSSDQDIVNSFDLAVGGSLRLSLEAEQPSEATSSLLTASVIDSALDDQFLGNNLDNYSLNAFPRDTSISQRTALKNRGSQDIDPKLDTIVLTHGLQPASVCDDSNLADSDMWSGNGKHQAGNLLNEVGNQNNNILQFIWSGACQGLFPTATSYINARIHVYDAAQNLARKLEMELGDSYSGNIQFIGHSLGTGVNAYAARIFAEKTNLRKLQITNLDYPNALAKSSSGVGIPGISKKDEDFYGFDEDFLNTVLPIDKLGSENVYVDNYYADGISSLGVGKEVRVNAMVVNHELVAPGKINRIYREGISGNDHSGSQQWYRWSIERGQISNGLSVCDDNTWIKDSTPVNLLITMLEDDDISLNPCSLGWNISILNNESSRDYLEQYYVREYSEGNSESVLAEFGEIRTAEDCEYENGTFVCGSNNSSDVVAANTRSSGAISSSEFVAATTRSLSKSSNVRNTSHTTAEVSFPAQTRYISFQYKFDKFAETDSFSFLLNGAEVWNVNGQNSSTDWVNSGPIPIGDLVVSENSITIALHSSENSRLLVRDVRAIAETQAAVREGFVFSRTDKDEMRWVALDEAGEAGNIWIDETCAESLGGATSFGDWADLVELAPGHDSIPHPCADPDSADINPDPSGYVYSRTDKSELRWIAGNANGQVGNIWIDERCAKLLGGPSSFGDWFDLSDVAPAHDSIPYPCADSSTRKFNFVFSRTDKEELRWVTGAGNGNIGSVWIDQACANLLGSQTISGDWSQLVALAPDNGSIAYPCAHSTNGVTGYVFSRTDKVEQRWITKDQSGQLSSVWIDEVCSESLGGPSVSGDWFDLIERAPVLDSIKQPC